MGEARSKRLAGPQIVYHHTSILWTNQIWMSGVVDVEGKPRRARHPVLGEVAAAPSLRPGFEDFPPLAWFTTRLQVPNCLVRYTLVELTKEHPHFAVLCRDGSNWTSFSRPGSSTWRRCWRDASG
jgi:hypothetical protein